MNAKRNFSNISEIEKHNNNNNNNHNNIGPPTKRQKTTPPNNNNIMLMNQSTISSYTIQETKMRISATRNIRHFNTMSDEELNRKISMMKNKVNRTLSLLQAQSNETMDLMEVANERYLYTKQQLKQERERANHFQAKNENLQKKLIENHNMLFKIFEQ